MGGFAGNVSSPFKITFDAVLSTRSSENSWLKYDIIFVLQNGTYYNWNVDCLMCSVPGSTINEKCQSSDANLRFRKQNVNKNINTAD